MTPTVVGLVALALMLMIFLSGMPVAYAMALVGWLGFSYLVSPQAGLGLLARDLVGTFSNYGLVVIPLFTLMGQLALHSGVSRRLYDAARAMSGATRGGLAMATVLACTGFGAVCGSTTATAATMATVGLPEMKRFGYDPGLAGGTVASGGGLGMLMPPSVVLIVYGVLTQQSIGRLFVAAIIPALVICALFMLAVFLVCWWRPDLGPPGEKVPWRQKIASLAQLAEVLAVFLLVMGGLIAGLFTPTEAAGVGAGGMLLVGLLRRSLSWAGFKKAINDTLWTSAMTMMLVAGAVVLGHFLAVTRLPFIIGQTVAELAWPSWAVIMAVVVIYLIGGCFIDALALIMLTIPIFYPLITGLGYDPIWFGVMIVLVTQMGVITPPVGVNVYIVAGIDGHTSLSAIFKGAMPFLAALALGAALMTAFPFLATWLPGVVY
ncbi:MAG: TRAP transporter large permease [Proteobacteria bacterium]|nr:TRAP transporter large permease [Pseudomonadota bacterium]MBU1452610.1 TRAP transporter large permease [Pseudomonadota bacterium]MBU2468750.1 TRAP transporter large permease [Pseudomonadota bacterium]MBU2519323.1 TRAP transporter large permease [Pseudomonadota bacterium]